MASYNCEWCKTSVDIHAKKCPQCGNNPSLKKVKGFPIFKLLAFIGLIFMSPVLYEAFIRSDESKIKSYTEELEKIPDNNFERIYDLRKKLLDITNEGHIEKVRDEYKKSKENYTSSLFKIIKSDVTANEELEAYKKLSEVYPNNDEYLKRIEKIGNPTKVKKDDGFMVIYAAKKSIRSRLKDGDSAKFRNVFYNNKVSPVACGEVNSKNSYGAYAGFSRFVSTGYGINFLQGDGDLFINSWNQLCVN